MAPPARSATLSIGGDEIAYSDTQQNADGGVSLSGGDLYPDPSFSDLSPQIGQTAISGGPFANPPNVPYTANLREASYLAQDGVLKGASISGAAYGKVTCSGVQTGDSVTLNGVSFAATATGAIESQFNVGETDAKTAANLRDAINLSTDANIVGKLQATKSLSDNSVVWIEARRPGIAGNDFALSSSNGDRLTIAPFAHGADGATATAPYWWVARTVTLATPLPAGKKIRFRFNLTGIEVTPLAGATAYLTLYFDGDGESAHYETLALSEGQVTSQEYAPLHAATIVKAGIAVIGYSGSWQVTNPHLLESSPDSYKTSGEFTIPINLSRAAGPPTGSATSGIGGKIKRFGFLFGSGLKESNLNGLQSGDVIATGIGDLSGISTNESEIITKAKAQGLEIYGYAALGEDNDVLNQLPYSEDQLKIFFNRAKTLGIDGIYFDICDNGPPWPNGFGVSRYRQVWAVNQCHALGLKVLFNSASTVLDDATNASDANPDEGTQHGISDGTPIPWKEGDGILAESWGLRSDGAAQDWTTFQATGLRMLQAKKNLGIRAYGLFYWLPSRTTLTQDYERRFAFFASAIFGLDGYSLYGGTNYQDDYERPSAYLGARFADSVPTVDASGDRILRKTDVGVVEITRDRTKSNASDTARDGSVYGNQQKITVSSLNVPETLNGGTISWKIASSADGSSYGEETALTDEGGVITGFPADLPSYAKLRAILTTPDATKSPSLIPPLALSVTYSGGAYAKLYGTALPSVSDGTVPTVSITYVRQGTNPLFVDGIAYSPVKDTVKETPSGAGIWEIYLPASSAGTTYLITLKIGDQSATKTVTLTANGSTTF